MNISIGIVGLPNAGKSSLFKALTREPVEIAKYPFTTVKPHHGIVKIPDPTLEALGEITHGNEVVPAVIEFVDIAGLIKGAHKGEGLGNQFLSHIRETAAIVEVVRAFPDPTVPHPEGNIDPERDIKTIDLELQMADLETAEREKARREGDVKSGKKEALASAAGLSKAIEILRKGKSLRGELPADEEVVLRLFHFLTAKPILFLLNVAEKTKMPSDEYVVLPLKLLAEVADLDEKEVESVLRDYGLEKNPLNILIRRAFELLDLITFYTVKPPETRAWLAKRGTPLPKAGSTIHSDFEEKFIKAEVIAAPRLLAVGDWHKAKAHGKVRLEGKAYIVQDGDVVEFKI